MIKVPTSSIWSNREPNGQDRIKELAADIKKNGLKRPILVRENMMIIDGLRRLEAVMLLGQDTIDAIVSDDLAEVLAAIEEIHGAKAKNRPELSTRRIYEFHRVIARLGRVRSRDLRAAGLWKLESRPDDFQTVGPLRAALTRALNLPNESVIARVSKLYRKAEADSSIATLVAQLESGQLTVDAAHVASEHMRLNGVITNAAEKRQLLEAALRNLDIVIKELRKLRLPLDFPTDELVPLLRQLRDHRTGLTILFRQFSKEIKDLK